MLRFARRGAAELSERKANAGPPAFKLTTSFANQTARVKALVPEHPYEQITSGEKVRHNAGTNDKKLAMAGD